MPGRCAMPEYAEREPRSAGALERGGSRRTGGGMGSVAFVPGSCFCAVPRGSRLPEPHSPRQRCHCAAWRPAHRGGVAAVGVTGCELIGSLTWRLSRHQASIAARAGPTRRADRGAELSFSKGLDGPSMRVCPCQSARGMAGSGSGGNGGGPATRLGTCGTEYALHEWSGPARHPRD